MALSGHWLKTCTRVHTTRPGYVQLNNFTTLRYVSVLVDVEQRGASRSLAQVHLRQQHRHPNVRLCHWERYVHSHTQSFLLMSACGSMTEGSRVSCRRLAAVGAGAHGHGCDPLLNLLHRLHLPALHHVQEGTLLLQRAVSDLCR